MDTRYGNAIMNTPKDTPKSSRCASPIGQSSPKPETDLRIAAKFIADGLLGRRPDDSNRACLCYILTHDCTILATSSAFKDKETLGTDISGVNAPEIQVLKSNQVTQALTSRRHDVADVHVITSSLTGAAGVLNALTSFAAHYPAIMLTLTLAKLTNLHRKDVRAYLWTLSNTTNVKVKVLGKLLMRHIVDDQQVTSQVLRDQGNPYNTYDNDKLQEILQEQECLTNIQSQLSEHHRNVSKSFMLLNSNITRAKVPLTKVTTGLSKTFKSENTTGSSRNTVPNALSLIRHVKKDWRHVSHLPKLDESQRHLAMLINDISETIQEMVTLQVIKQAFDDANISLLRGVACSGFYCREQYQSCLDALKSCTQEVNDLLQKQKTADDKITQLDDDVTNLSRDSWQPDADTWCLNGIGLKVLTDIILLSKSLVNDLLGLHYKTQGTVINLHVLLSKLQLANKTQALNLHKQAGDLVKETKVKQQVKGPVKTLEVILKQCTGSAQGQGHLLETEIEENKTEPPSQDTSRPGSPSDLPNDLETDQNELEAFTDEEVLKLTIRQYNRQAKSV